MIRLTWSAEFNIVGFSNSRKNRSMFLLFCFFCHCSCIPVAFLVSVALFFQTQPSYMRKACKPHKFLILELGIEHKDKSCSPFHARSQQNKHGWVICTLNYLTFLFVLLSHLCSVVSLSCCFFFSYQRNNKSKWCMKKILVITSQTLERLRFSSSPINTKTSVRTFGWCCFHQIRRYCCNHFFKLISNLLQWIRLHVFCYCEVLNAHMLLCTKHNAAPPLKLQQHLILLDIFDKKPF